MTTAAFSLRCKRFVHLVACSNTPMILSNNATQSVEQVAAAAKGQLWWQFYPRQDLDASREALERAQTAGYTAIDMGESARALDLLPVLT